jgi:hypothetical protein
MLDMLSPGGAVDLAALPAASRSVGSQQSRWPP